MDLIDKELFYDSFQYFDKEIVAEIIDIFLGEYNDRLVTIEKSIESRNFDDLKFHAHSLKGVVANFAAPPLQEVAKELELKGTNSEDVNLVEDFGQLKKLTLQLADELSIIKEEYN